jgi:hypothetical protein
MKAIFIEWVAYIWVMALAMLGGGVGYMQKVKSGRVKFRWMALFVELMTSGFVGLLTYLLCHSSGVSEPLTAVMVGVSGHMGTRALMQLEAVYKRLFPGQDQS